MGIVGATYIFRLVMYLTKLEDVTRVKVSPEAWKNAAIREVAFAWTKTLGMYICFRGLIATWGFFLPDDIMKWWFCFFNLCADSFMLLQMLSPSHSRQVLVHQQKAVPLLIQVVVTAAGCAIFL